MLNLAENNANDLHLIYAVEKQQYFSVIFFPLCNSVKYKTCNTIRGSFLMLVADDT